MMGAVWCTKCGIPVPHECHKCVLVSSPEPHLVAPPPDPDQADRVLEAAIRAVGTAMADGEKHGKNGKWLRQGYDEQVRHARGHVNSTGTGERLMHLQHALCRIAMAICFIEGEGE